jgi:hypothetical protein
MDISLLSKALHSDIAYPPEMACVETGILGRGFYPGCRGFSPKRSPIGGIMLLGRDFGTKTYYDRLAGSPPRDENALTWRHTRDIYLSELRPSLGDLPVWCTNYLMGVRICGSAVGTVKNCIVSEDWIKFETSCWNFLQKQVLLQKPLVILVLGGDNRRDLAAPGRLGGNEVEPFRRTFVAEGKLHEASIFYTDHPHSLIKATAKESVHKETEKIRAFYLSCYTRTSQTTPAGMEEEAPC